jgi:glycosyltransferase involved in cell wall biosynthesis
MNKVLFFVGDVDNPSSGPFQASINIVKSLEDKGICARVIGNCDSKLFSVNLSSNIIGLPRFGPSFLQFSLFGVYRLFKEVRSSSIVFVEGVWFLSLVWFLIFSFIFTNKKFVLSLHGNFNPYALGVSFGRKYIFSKLFFPILLRRFILRLLSEKEKDYAQEYLKSLGLSIRRYTVISNPVIFDDFLNCNDRDSKYFLYLGRLDPIKNIELLLSLWCNRSVLSEYQLLIAGSGLPSYVDHLRRTCTCDGVVFVGFADPTMKSKLFCEATGAFLLSYSEGLPVAVLESLSFGCPVIISHEVYSDSLHGLTGIFKLSPNSCQAEFDSFLVECLSFNQDPKERTDLISRFSISSLSERFINLSVKVYE